MFAPKGFTPLSALMRKVPDAIREEVEEADRVFAYKNQHGDGYALGVLSGTSPLDTIERLVFMSIADNAHLASHGGAVLAFDIQRLIDVMEYWEYDLTDLSTAEKKSQGGPPVPPDFVHSSLLGEWGLNEMLAEYDAAPPDDVSLLDWLDGRAEYSTAHQRLPMFVERRGYTINLDTFDILARHPDFRIEEFAGFRSVLRPFVGWALCVDAEFANDGWAPALWAQMDKERASFGAGRSPPQKNGRPDVLIRTATEAYLSLFPAGHSDTPVKVLCEQIGEKIGRPVSPRTMRRVLEAAKPPEHSAKTSGKR